MVRRGGLEIVGGGCVSFRQDGIDTFGVINLGMNKRGDSEVCTETDRGCT